MTIRTLQPDAAAGIDTYVGLLSPDTNSDTAEFLGVRGWPTTKENALIKFDLSGLAGATIISATLSLYGLGSGSSGTFDIYRILAANSTWTKAGATWNHTDGANHWAGDAGSDGGADAGCSQSGTDHSATLIATGAFNSTAGQESTFALDLTEFGLMVAANHGVIIKDAAVSAGEKQPGSSNNSTAGRRPKLVIDYLGSGSPWYQYAQG